MACIFARLWVETFFALRKAQEVVILVTPARAATSAKVAVRFMGLPELAGAKLAIDFSLMKIKKLTCSIDAGIDTSDIWRAI